MSSYECRICFGEGTDINDFISPCCCTGESKHVHKNCLNHWLINNKTTDKYFKCEVCHCKYQRSSFNEKNEIIEKKVGITGLLVTTISFTLLIFSILLINFSIMMCNIFLIILYLISLSYVARYNFNDSLLFSVIIIIYLGSFYCSEKYRKTIAEFWLMIVFMISSYEFVNDGWNFIYKLVEVDYLTENKSQMYDKYLGVYVDGII